MKLHTMERSADRIGHTVGLKGRPKDGWCRDRESGRGGRSKGLFIYRDSSRPLRFRHRTRPTSELRPLSVPPPLTVPPRPHSPRPRSHRVQQAVYLARRRARRQPVRARELLEQCVELRPAQLALVITGRGCERDIQGGEVLIKRSIQRRRCVRRRRGVCVSG
jgi:hypothetical protein